MQNNHWQIINYSYYNTPRIVTYKKIKLIIQIYQIINNKINFKNYKIIIILILKIKIIYVNKFFKNWKLIKLITN